MCGVCLCVLMCASICASMYSETFLLRTPVYRGVPNAEVDLNIAQYGWDCRVSSLERGPLFRVSFKQRFHCSSYLLWDAACIYTTLFHLDGLGCWST